MLVLILVRTSYSITKNLRSLLNYLWLIRVSLHFELFLIFYILLFILLWPLNKSSSKIFFFLFNSIFFLSFFQLFFMNFIQLLTPFIIQNKQQYTQDKSIDQKVIYKFKLKKFILKINSIRI